MGLFNVLFCVKMYNYMFGKLTEFVFLQNSVAKPIQKSAKAATEETSSRSPKIDKKKSPYGLWIPV